MVPRVPIRQHCVESTHDSLVKDVIDVGQKNNNDVIDVGHGEKDEEAQVKKIEGNNHCSGCVTGEKLDQVEARLCTMKHVSGFKGGGGGRGEGEEVK